MNFAKLIDADKIGGWVRAGTAAAMSAILAKFPGLSTFLDPVTQAALATFLSGIAVGAWSQLTKSDAAKVEMAAEVPSVTRIETTDPVIAAMPAPEVQLAK